MTLDIKAARAVCEDPWHLMDCYENDDPARCPTCNEHWDCDVAERETLAAQVLTLTTDRDSWRAKCEAAERSAMSDRMLANGATRDAERDYWKPQLDAAIARAEAAERERDELARGRIDNVRSHVLIDAHKRDAESTTTEAIAALADNEASQYLADASTYEDAETRTRWQGKATALRTFAADIRAGLWRTHRSGQ